MYIEFSLNFLLFLLSQIVKLKTKKIKPFCFARAKYFRFVDVAFCFPVCESPFFVVCMCFCVMRNLILLLFVVNCERFFIFLSLVETQNDHKITKKKNLYRTTLKRKQKWFVFDCLYVLWNRSNCDDGTRWNIIADSGSIETNEKNAGKCRDSTKRKFFGSAVSLLILVTICIFFVYVDVSFK